MVLSKRRGFRLGHQSHGEYRMGGEDARSAHHCGAQCTTIRIGIGIDNTNERAFERLCQCTSIAEGYISMPACLPVNIPACESIWLQLTCNQQIHHDQRHQRDVVDVMCRSEPWRLCLAQQISVRLTQQQHQFSSWLRSRSLQLCLCCWFAYG